ncbi:TylF/MycF/NovP-related O-methyltransferase [Micromonospora sp. NPDC005324]|uniref:TylF/MycF/NovP-related O-methyltransferase n=1 Tax=Micromonospora sp. NPDC005324 TaxID=3157033 RepID=UPI0033A817D6
MSGRLETLREWLLAEHANTVDADRLTAIAAHLRQTIEESVEGALVEVGCYRGAMALWMRAVLNDFGDSRRQIHVYDSFAGLPAPGDRDSSHLREGELVSTPADVEATHVTWNEPSPVIHPGWFADTLPRELPHSIAFGYLDGDFYDSIHVSLTECVPRLSRGGVLIIDDYADTVLNPKAWDGLPGVKRACDDYFGTPSPVEVLVGDGDLAFGLYRRVE